MRNFALGSCLAASVVIMTPLLAHAAPVADGNSGIVIAQRGDGGGKGGGGGGGRGGSPGGGAGRSAGGGGDGARRFDGGRGDGGDMRGGGRELRGDRGGRDADRGSRRADPDVRRGNRGSGYGYRGGKRHSRDFIRQRGHRYSWGPGIGFYFYDGYYYGDCDWLQRRAIATGSGYWWDRYNQCIDW